MIRISGVNWGEYDILGDWGRTGVNEISGRWCVWIKLVRVKWNNLRKWGNQSDLGNRGKVGLIG